ncbi:MAG: hypothetical protein M1829_003073 [Trizodia sp. TS-e1964]|nr:MAG: hypothetical protein M1829_003073 [Trizodia sp. TS-e1964]
MNTTLLNATNTQWINNTQPLTSSSSHNITNSTLFVNVTSGGSSTFSTSSSIAPSSSSVSVIATSTEVSAVPTSPSTASPPNTVLVLGITLGTICSLIALIACVLLCLRMHRKQKDHAELGHQRRASGIPQYDDTDSAYFDDGGGGGRMGHQYQDSTSSRAIIAGRARGGHRRGLFTGRSSGSNASTVFGRKKSQKQNGSPISFPGQEMNLKEQDMTLTLSNNAGPLTRNSSLTQNASLSRNASLTRNTSVNLGSVPDESRNYRSSGWSRYFSGSSAFGALGRMNSGRSAASRSSYGSRSHYVNSQTLDVEPRASTIISPLNIGRSSTGHQLKVIDDVSPVASSPSHYRPASGETVSSDGHEKTAWTPVAATNWAKNRPPSSVYTDSPQGSAFPRNSSYSTFNRDAQPRNIHVTDGTTEHTLEYEMDPMRPALADISWLKLGEPKL